MGETVHRVRSLFASVSDSSAAATGSFLISIAALRALDTTQLALYTLMFSAGIVAMILPQMAFLPRQMKQNLSEARVRPRYLSDIVAGLPFGAAGVAIMAVSGAPLYAQVGAVQSVGMIAFAGMWVFASSFQDHVRASLHISEQHGYASAVSILYLVLCGLAFFAVWDERVAQSEVASQLPFAALGVTNLVSGLFGMLLHRTTPKIERFGRVTLAQSIRTSASGLITQSAAYATNFVTLSAIGAAALAELESARVAAQPVLTVAIGVVSYFVPAMVRAQRSGDRGRVLQGLRSVVLLIMSGALVYSAMLPLIAGPLSAVAGRPIDPGLAAARASSSAAQATMNPFNQLDIAADRYRRAITATSVSVAVGLLVLCALITTLGVYAVPISMATMPVIHGAILYMSK